MAEQQGFLSGYAGNPVQRGLRWGADKLLAGNNRGADGRLTNVGRGLIGTGVKALAGLGGMMYGGPLVGKAVSSGVGKMANNWVDTGNAFGGGMPGGVERMPMAPFNPGIDIGGYQGGVTFPTMNLGFGQPSQIGAMVGNRMDAGVGRALNDTLATNEARIGAELSANLAAGKQSRDSQPRGNVIWRPGEMMLQQHGQHALMDQLSRMAAAGQSPYNRRA